MKIAAFFRVLKFVSLLVGVSAALGVPMVKGAEINFADLVLTENSSTNLSLTYTGPSGASSFSVLNTSPDHWTITYNNPNLAFTNFKIDWQEPEEPNEVNEVSHLVPNVQDGFSLFNTITVISDLDFLLDGNGAALPNNSPAFVGFDGQFGIRLIFNDLAAPAEVAGVPEAGTTLGLLSFSVGGLLAFARRRKLA